MEGGGCVVLTIIAGVLGIIFFIFWLAELIFVHRGIRRSRLPEEQLHREGVTVIKPIKELDYQLDVNLRSWIDQEYAGPAQYIFSFQDPADPGLGVVHALKSEYADKDIEIIVNPVLPGLNGKSSNMHHGLQIAKYDILVFGDSDTRVLPTYLDKMVNQLFKPKVGLVTSAQMDIEGDDFWTRFFTYTQNNETVFHWGFLARLGMRVGANGAGFAIKREVLDEAGGFHAFGNTLLEDLLMGNMIMERGYKMVLGPFIEAVPHKVPRAKALNYMQRITIGLRTLLRSEMPVFIFMLFWYWGLLIAGLIAGNPTAVAMSLGFIGMRTVMGLMQRWVVEGSFTLYDILMPVFFDLFGTGYLFYSFRNKTVIWRGIEYEIDTDGSIAVVGEE